MEGERRRRRLRRSQPPATDPSPPDPGHPDSSHSDPSHPNPGRSDPRPARVANPGPGSGSGAAPADRTYADTAPVHDPEPDAARPPAATGPEEREAERGLRGLVGSGTSQVGTGAALRARDAARPTEADLAAAEEHLVIIRRNWVPRDDLPRTR